ncbi:MAG TPA: hypothetical protein VIP11_01495 [Gemmatimonadaceae bacterium]
MGLEMAVHFRGPAIDGPFQLYNTLRRIWVGQRPGVDFQFFHGLGIPYLHYVQFRLFGGNFFASEISRQLTSAIVYPITVVIFLRFFLKDWTRVAVWSAIVMALSIALKLTSVLMAINSLLGIRSTIPVFLPVVLAMQIDRRIRALLSGVVIGMALFFGSEQGLALIAAIVLGSVIALWRRGDRVALLGESIAAIGAGVLTLACLLLAIGGVDGLRGAFAYNFRLVPMDQYWYFGAPPNLFVSGWDSLLRLMRLIPRVPETFAVGVGVAIYAARRFLRAKDERATREEFALTVFALYGLVSCATLLGTFVHVYVQPLIRVILLIGAVYVSRGLSERDARGGAQILGVGRSTLATAAASVIAMFVMVPSMIGTIGLTVPHFVRDHVIGDEHAAYTDIWPETIDAGQRILESRRNADGSLPTLWSTYAGLLEARNGLFQPSFDYVIHALGPANRTKYLETFRAQKPKLVQTILPTYSQYESWIEGTSWDFYADLLQNYKIIGDTPWSYFWERQPSAEPAPTEVWSAKVPANATTIDLPAAPGANGIVLLQAELTYRVRNPLGFLPVVGALPRYLLSIQNAAHRQPTTLNPYVTVSRIPIVAFRGKPVRLSWAAFSPLPGAGIDVDSVKLYFFPVSDANAPWLTKVYARQMGDQEE